MMISTICQKIMSSWVTNQMIYLGYLILETPELLKKKAIMQGPISFDVLVLVATARLAVINGLQYLCVLDVLMHICDITPIKANDK